MALYFVLCPLGKGSEHLTTSQIFKFLLSSSPSFLPCLFTQGSKLSSITCYKVIQLSWTLTPYSFATAFPQNSETQLKSHHPVMKIQYKWGLFAMKPTVGFRQSASNYRWCSFLKMRKVSSVFSQYPGQ